MQATHLGKGHLCNGDTFSDLNGLINVWWRRTQNIKPHKLPKILLSWIVPICSCPWTTCHIFYWLFAWGDLILFTKGTIYRHAIQLYSSVLSACIILITLSNGNTLCNSDPLWGSAITSLRFARCDVGENVLDAAFIYLFLFLTDAVPPPPPRYSSTHLLSSPNVLNWCEKIQICIPLRNISTEKVIRTFPWHIAAGTKLGPLCKRHFHINFLELNCWFFIPTSLNAISRVQLRLNQIIDWDNVLAPRGNKPIYNPMKTTLTDAPGVTRPQWVKYDKSLVV